MCSRSALWLYVLVGLQDILSDPELLQAFQDPDVTNAFMEISQDPSSINKYKDIPKVHSVI